MLMANLLCLAQLERDIQKLTECTRFISLMMLARGTKTKTPPSPALDL